VIQHKSSIYDLALFGGEPTFESTLHVGRPNIGDFEDAIQLRVPFRDEIFVSRSEFQGEFHEE